MFHRTQKMDKYCKCKYCLNYENFHTRHALLQLLRSFPLNVFFFRIFEHCPMNFHYLILLHSSEKIISSFSYYVYYLVLLPENSISFFSWDLGDVRTNFSKHDCSHFFSKFQLLLLHPSSKVVRNLVFATG